MTLIAALVIPVQLVAQEQLEGEGHHRYKLIDLGTLGGPESYINAAFSLGAPNQINNRGTVVGAAATLIPTPPNKQICGGPDGLVPFVFHAFEWQNGVLTDLGALPGIECSQAVSINANGEIVGGSGNGVIDPVAGVIEEVRAVLWKDGEIRDLGTLGGSESTAVAINNRGQVTGFSTNAIPDPFSLLYFPAGFTNGTQTRAFLWHKGHMQDLHTLGGPDAQAFGLNERGQVIGISYINSTPNPTTGVPTADPFLWTKDRGMVDLGTLGGVWGSADTLNNRGQVIGTSSLAAGPGACLNGPPDPNLNPDCHPFLWDDGKLIDLTVQSGGIIVNANAINDAGEIVGLACFPNGTCHAYLWRNGVITDLGALPGDCFSQPFAINSRGQVVGQSFSCGGSGGRVFLWENGSMIDLNALVPPGSGLQLDNTEAINDRGEIGGEGLPSGCSLDTQCGHAFLLIPCDGDRADVAGCEDENEGPTIVTQSNPASVNQNSTNLSQASGLTPEMLAALRARSARRYPGFGVWPRR
jgi:probable HAF family extracellular repeat protein